MGEPQKTDTNSITHRGTGGTTNRGFRGDRGNQGGYARVHTAAHCIDRIPDSRELEGDRWPQRDRNTYLLEVGVGSTTGSHGWIKNADMEIYLSLMLQEGK